VTDGSLSWLHRMGAALLAPERALAAAASMPGRTPGDAALLMLVYFLTVHMSDAAVAFWLLGSGEIAHGLMQLGSRLADALKGPLLFLLVSAVGLTLLAGKRRSLGADFDLASVALVPLLAVHALANLVVILLRLPVTAPLGYTVNAVAYAWAAVVLFIAYKRVQQRARRGGDER
jgi:hypothetical protein